MANINLYFVLLDPKRIPQRIVAGDLGQGTEEWTLARLLSDTDDWARSFQPLTDKVAYMPRSPTTLEYFGIELGEGWVELAVEAASMLHALMIAQRAGIILQRKRKTEQS